MQLFHFLIAITGATMLLNFAIKLVQTGVERSIGESFNRWIALQDNPLKLTGLGVVLAIILQSANAVSLLVASFIHNKSFGFLVGLPIVLGADLGSAIVVQVLSFHIAGLMELLLTTGGWLFLKSTNIRVKNFGRILLGLALILLALHIFRETMTPIKSASFLPQLNNFLAQDLVASFILGIAFAALMQSSIAVVLIIVGFVGMGSLDFTASLAIILGANVGSALIPVIMSRNLSIEARRIPWANLILRSLLAIIVLTGIGALQTFQTPFWLRSPHSVLLFHLCFNFILIIFVSTRHTLAKIFIAILPEQRTATIIDEGDVSALDKSALTSPAKSLASFRREIIRMSQLVEKMILPIMDCYKNGDPALIMHVSKRRTYVSSALNSVRQFVANLPMAQMSKSQSRAIRALAEYAINLDAVADIIDRRLMVVAENKSKNKILFSKSGWKELQDIHEKVVSNMRLAFDVLVSKDLDDAKLLIDEKHHLTEKQRESRREHLKRIHDKSEDSIASSDLHLESLGALKDINSQLAAIGYLVLEKQH